MGIPKRQIWKLNREVIFSPTFHLIFCSFFLLPLIMNMMIWNCRGALSPTFRNNVSELVRVHSPAIMIITKTKVNGDRAKKIADRLPLDGVILQTHLGLLVVSRFFGTLIRWMWWSYLLLNKRFMQSSFPQVNLPGCCHQSMVAQDLRKDAFPRIISNLQLVSIHCRGL